MKEVGSVVEKDLLATAEGTFSASLLSSEFEGLVVQRFRIMLTLFRQSSLFVKMEEVRGRRRSWFL